MQELAVSVDAEKVHFTSSVRENRFRITNAGDATVAYKMKMSTRDGYNVRPRGGFVGAGEGVEIVITVDVGGLHAQSRTAENIVIETRELSAVEETARSLCSKDDDAGMRAALGITPAVPVSTAKDLALWMLKNAKEKTREKILQLGCTLDPALLQLSANRGAPKAEKATPVSTPAPAPAGSAAPMTVMSETALSTEIDFAAKEVTRLKADINAMEQKQQELSSANRLHQAASEELRSKAENVASTLPLYAVVVLWLVFFYIGLTLDKYYSVE